jgi:hypothetical protein
LYTTEPIGYQMLRYIDKEPDRDFPDYAELQLGAVLSGSVLQGEYLARHFKLGENHLLYRAGDTFEIIQALNMVSGLGAVAWQRTPDPKPDQVFFVPGDPPVMIKYHAASGLEEVHQLAYNPGNGRVAVEKIQERMLPAGDSVSYASMQQQNMRRIVRFSRRNCRLEISKVKEDGTLQPAVPAHQFDSSSCPELFAVYRGTSSYFMYTQSSPFAYTISQLSIDGEVVQQQTHSSSFSDTPFDHLAVHHIYEQSRPFFIFWDSRGAIKVKVLADEFVMNPFAVNIKQFTPPLDPAMPRWASSTLLRNQ